MPKHLVKKTGKKCKLKKSEKSWTTEMMCQAMEAVGNSMTLCEAARKFGVPKSTLSLKLRCFTPVECKKGPSTILNSDKENEIVNWIIFCAERGFPVTKNHLFDCAQDYLVRNKKKNPFKNNRPGKHWYKAFMRRHPSLAQKVSQNLTTTRAAVTETNLRGWFSTVHENLKKKGLLSIGPERIFNLHESAFMMVPEDNTVITKKGEKSVYQIVSASDKACITTLITASASGDMAPPMILFDSKRTQRKSILDNIPKGWGVGHTESGWISAESFYYYITNVFFKWLTEKNHPFPVVLYVDGHSSHCTLPLVKFCKDNQIELIALYPNATHIIQPLDVALFRPLKASYAKENRKYKIENNVVDFKKWMFASVLKKALEAVDFSKTIQSGFRATGLCPFNPDAVNYDIINKSKKTNNCLEACTSNNSENIPKIDSNVQGPVGFLQMFENQIISPSTLELFKKHETEASWTGDIKLEGLFEAWKKALQICETQVNENLAIDSQQIVKVENIIHGDLLQNSPLEYDVLTIPTVSIKTEQEPEENIDLFPNQSSSDLLQSDNSEEPNSVNSMEIIFDNNLYIHENNFNLSSKSPSVCINSSETTIKTSTSPEVFEEIQKILYDCKADLSCRPNISDKSKKLWTANNNESIQASVEIISTPISSTSGESTLSFETSFSKPNFNTNKKKKRKMSNENTPIACTVDDNVGNVKEKRRCQKIQRRRIV